MREEIERFRGSGDFMGEILAMIIINNQGQRLPPHKGPLMENNLRRTIKRS